MSQLVEDYLRRVEETLRMRPTERAHIVSELRGHIMEKVADETAAHPDLADDEITRRVLADFGSPDDLALAYTPEGDRVLKGPRGEEVVRIGRAVGRGAGRVLKIVGIVVAVCLVLAIAGGVFAYYELKPLIEKNAPYPVYEYNRHCEPCDGAPVRDTFFVHDGAREVRLDLGIHPDEGGNGTVRITIADANGTIRYDQVFGNENPGRSNTHKTVVPVAGEWRVTYEYTRFGGWVDVDVITLGMPEGTLW